MNQKRSLYETLVNDYPLEFGITLCITSRNEEISKMLKLADLDKKLNTWRDFAEILAKYEEQDEKEMTVSKSSVWAVCQEFLGNLHGEDLEYAQTRGGMWSYIRPVTVREILERLQEDYP